MLKLRKTSFMSANGVVKNTHVEPAPLIHWKNYRDTTQEPDTGIIRSR